MSVAVLKQVYAEVRRLAIAGSTLAVGDFRLKKLVEPLEKSAEKAQVFGTVAKAIDRLVSGSEQESAQALLDLSSLVVAILYTQGDTSAPGTMVPLESKSVSISSTQVSARVLKPLIEALSQTGSGRLEIIREAHAGGAFDDLRVVNYAIAALDDTYAEIGDFIADEVLPKYGLAVVPEIRDRIDIKGRAGNVRRLRLYHRLDPAGARAIVLEAFENGSKEMKIAALGCLGDSSEDLPHLLEQASAKSKEVRAVALQRLSKFDDPVAIAILLKALDGADRELVVGDLGRNPSDDLWAKVIERTLAESTELSKIKEKEKLAKALQRFQQLLHAYRHTARPDALQTVNQLYDQREQLLKLKAAPISGADLVHTIGEILLESLEPKALKRLVEDRESLADDFFDLTFTAAVLSLPEKKLFDAYSPYFQDLNKQKKKIREDRLGRLHQLLQVQEDNEYSYYRFRHYWRKVSEAFVAALKKRKWDARWVEVAIANDDFDSVSQLADAKNKGAKAYLQQRYQQLTAKRQTDYEAFSVLMVMARLQYPETTDLLIEALRHTAKHESRYYYAHWYNRIIALLPKASADKLEAIMPELPDRMADELLPMVQGMRSKE